jgi:hypothetical protein
MLGSPASVCCRMRVVAVVKFGVMTAAFLGVFDWLERHR